MRIKKTLNKAIKEISERRDYVVGDKGILEKTYRKLKDDKPESKSGKIGRVAGLGLIDLGWILWCLGKYTLKDLNVLLLDNEVIDKWHEKNKNTKSKMTDSQFKQWFDNLKRSHPKAAARLRLWLIYTLLAGMTVIGVKNSHHKDTDGQDKQEQDDKKKKDNEITIDKFKIDPNASEENWNKQIDAIWPYLYMETILSEGFINEAYADVGESGGYITIGSGFMIGKANPKGKKDYKIIRERKNFFKKVLGKSYVNGVKLSYEENKILIRAYYETYVWPYMKKSFTHPMDAHLFIELCIGNFNRGPGIYQSGYDGENIRDNVNSGKSLKDIVNSFDDLCKAGNSGLAPKYGVAAHRVLGDITDEDILNSLANSVYQMSASKIWDQKGTLKEYDTIARDLLSIKTADVYKNGKTYIQHPLKDYLTENEVSNIKQGKLFSSVVEYAENEPQKVETTAEQLNEQGEDFYNKNEYREAITKFYAALEQDPTMGIVYSNLALSYYKLGEYENAVSVINGFIESQYFQNTPANVKGYTYYNLALNYEKLGDGTQNITQRQKYYEQAKQNAERGETVANTKYKSFSNRINTKIANVRAQKNNSFSKGVKKITKQQTSGVTKNR